MKHITYTAFCLFLLFGAGACKKSAVIPAEPATLAQSLDFVYPETEEAKIYVDEAGISIYPMVVGEKVQLSYELYPSEEELTHPEVEFISSDPSVLDVTSEGLINALAEGSATLTLQTATVNLGVTKTILVKVVATVVPATGITVTDDATEVDETYGLPKIAIGEQMHLTAKISPDNATYKTVFWTSENTEVATVDKISGTVTGLSKGRVTIRANALDGSGVSKGHEIFIDKTVEPQGIALVEVPAEGYTCSVTDEPVAISYSLTPADATKSLVVWESSDPSIATVSAKGIVSFVKYGKVTITATCPGTEEAPAGYAKSVSVVFNIPAGFYREHFENGDNRHWSMSAAHVKSGGTEVFNEGTRENWMLYTPYLSGIVGRGDLQHNTGSKTYISPDYPILTFRIDDVNDRTWDKSGTATKYSRNINIDVSGNVDEGSGTKYSGNILGTDGKANNKWKIKYTCSDGSAILVYDLTVQGFGTGGILPAGSICWMNTFQIKYADINKNGNPNVTAADINYRMFWFHTFTSETEMKTYLDKWSAETGITYEQ